MSRMSLVLSLLGAMTIAQSFQMHERVDGWLIERKLTDKQEPICRASLPGGGAWFSARVHLNRNNELVIPNGLSAPNPQSVALVRKALRACRSSILQF